MANDGKTDQQVACDAVVVDKDGNQALKLAAPPRNVAAGQKAVIKLSGPMTNIHLWSPDFPYLYKVYSIVSVKGKAVDVLATPIGIRQFTFSAGGGCRSTATRCI